MGENTKISWTDNTFNPWLGCTKVSPGCLNCYADDVATNVMGIDVFGKDRPRFLTTNDYWRTAIKWDQEVEDPSHRRRVFCGSMCDVFERYDDPLVRQKRTGVHSLCRFGLSRPGR